MTSEYDVERELKMARMETSADVDARILADAGAVLQRSVSPAVATSDCHTDFYVESPQLRRRHRRIAIIASCLSSMIITAGVLWVWLVRSEMTWAQVGEAVKAHPWMHAKAKLPDGTEIEGWTSFEREIDAGREGDHVHFTDHRLGIMDSYNAAEKTIYRTADMTGHSRASFLAFTNLFKDLFSGKEELSLSGLKIVRQTRHTVNENGMNWIEVELVIDEGGGEAEYESMIFRINPKTKLPVQLTAINPGAEPNRVVLALDYPKTGPADIYALGVPRDAKVVDQVPKGNLKQIFAAIRTVREQFEDYQALQVWRVADDPWYRGTPMRIWYRRTPGQRRNDYGFEYPGFKVDQPPGLDVDQRAWWKEHSKRFWYVPFEIQDGASNTYNDAKPENVLLVKPPYQFDPVKWPKPHWTSSSDGTPDSAFSSPVQFAYPGNLLGGNGANIPKLRDRTKGDGGLLILDWATEHYTIDPARGFMTVRTDTEYTAEGESKPNVWSIIVEESAQSPKGFWYPTRIRSIERRDGQPTREDHVWQFYLDFNSKIPDSTFKPVDHVITDPVELP